MGLPGAARVSPNSIQNYSAANAMENLGAARVCAQGLVSQCKLYTRIRTAVLGNSRRRHLEDISEPIARQMAR